MFGRQCFCRTVAESHREVTGRHQAFPSRMSENSGLVANGWGVALLVTRAAYHATLATVWELNLSSGIFRDKRIAT